MLEKAVRAIYKENRAESLSKVLGPDFKTKVLYRANAREAHRKLALLLNICKEALTRLEAQPCMPDSEEVRIFRYFSEKMFIV